jgi:hypothetical protein
LFNFEDDALIFLVNGKEVEIGPFSADYFAKNKREINSNEEHFDEYSFRLQLMVTEAISNLENVPLSVTHQSGGVAYEAWRYDGSFYGYYTVYSDYANLHSIDAGSYGMLKREISSNS